MLGISYLQIDDAQGTGHVRIGNLLAGHMQQQPTGMGITFKKLNKNTINEMTFIVNAIYGQKEGS